MTELANLLRPLAMRIANLFARGRVRSVNAVGKMQVLQLDLLAGETKDRLEHMEPYGFTSHPKAGAEAAAAFLDGDRSHGIVLVVADRRYRLTGLAEGEVAISDDLGQKVHLTRAGLVINGAGLPMTIQNTPLVTMQTSLKVTGSIVADGDISDHGNKSMAGMRTTYNGHTHNDPQGGVVAAPNQAM